MQERCRAEGDVPRRRQRPAVRHLARLAWTPDSVGPLGACSWRSDRLHMDADVARRAALHKRVNEQGGKGHRVSFQRMRRSARCKQTREMRLKRMRGGGMCDSVRSIPATISSVCQIAHDRV